MLASQRLFSLALATAGLEPLSYYLSDLIDFTATTSGLIELWPSTPGYVGVSIGSVFLMQVGTGTSTVPLIMQGGNNAAEDNYFASATFSSAANQAAITAGVPVRNGNMAPASGLTAKTLLDLSSPIFLKITQAAAGTGGFAMSGRILTTLNLAAA